MGIYITDNIKKILNSDNILYFKTGFDLPNTVYLYSMITNNDGSYTKIPLTMPDKLNLFYVPHFPLFNFFKYYNNIGNISMENFIIRHNSVGDVYAINKKHYQGIGYCKCSFDPQKIEIYAVFKDGATTKIDIQKKSKFLKKGIKEYESSIIEHDEENIKKHIEDYLEKSTMLEPIFSSIQKEQQKIYVKKLD